MADSPLLPSAELILKGLDGEIERLRLERQEPGLNNWALLAGIGALLWTASSSLDTLRFTRGLLAALIALSVLLDAILTTTVLASNHHDNAIRYKPFADTAPNRVIAILGILRAVCIIAAVIWLSGSWHAVASLAALASYGIQTIFLLMAIAYSFSTYASRPSKMTWTIAAAVGTFAIADFYVSWRMSVLMWSAWRAGQLGANELHFVGALVAAIYLVSLLKEATPNASLRLLYLTRRELAFGRIGVDKAIEQGEIAVLGFKLEQFVQDEIAEFGSVLEHMKSQLDQAQSKVAALKLTVPHPAPFSPEEWLTVYKDEVVIGAHLGRAAIASTKLERALVLLGRKSRIGNKEDLDEMRDRLKASMAQVKSTANEAHQAVATIRHLFDALDLPTTDGHTPEPPKDPKLLEGLDMIRAFTRPKNEEQSS
jgi:hypothetical protein